MTLLDEAKKLKYHKNTEPYNDEFIELTLATIKGEISLSQASRAMGIGTRYNKIVYRMFTTIRDEVKDGKLKIERIKK